MAMVNDEFVLRPADSAGLAFRKGACLSARKPVRLLLARIASPLEPTSYNTLQAAVSSHDGDWPARRAHASPIGSVDFQQSVNPLPHVAT